MQSEKHQQKLKRGAPEVSIVVPTLNESENLEGVVSGLAQVLGAFNWEVIFVDDHSADGTAELAHAVAQKNPRVRCIERIGRRGLSSAVLEGMLSSSAPVLAVIDADLQHDITKLPQMIELLLDGESDLVVGSRYASGGSLGGWEQRRARISRFSTWLGRRILHVEVSDPMSGFFVIRRSVMRECVGNGVSGIGFKILLDLLSSAKRPLRVAEVPYTFGTRQRGESKLGSLVAWEFGMMLLYKRLGGVIPLRLLSFSLVGGSGVLVHFLMLTLCLQGLGAGFVASQTAAVLVSMVSNFTLNNWLTYPDLRLRGWHWIWGLVTFSASCSVGLLANVGVASVIYDQGAHWTLSAAAGILCGLVWNYLITSIFTWRRKNV